MSFHVFKRKNWKPNPRYPHGYEPHGNRDIVTVDNVETIDEAREICKEHNDTRPAYPLPEHFEFEVYEFEEE